MRHLLAADAVASLAGRMAASAVPGPLIATAGRAQRRLPGLLRAGPRTVALASIAAPAQKEQLATV